MNGKGARNKGANGERELFKLLSEELGIIINRNLTQTRLNGGADTLDVPFWDIECKRVEKLNINAAWTQTVNQCQPDKQPILFYRQSRQPWRAMLLLSSINLDYNGMPYVATVDFLTACMLIKESL